MQSYVFTLQRPGIHPARLPHSETHGSKRMCRSPWLIAACRVLHRLLAPRHSSCALRSLINLFLQLIHPKTNGLGNLCICCFSLYSSRNLRPELDHLHDLNLNQTQFSRSCYFLTYIQMSKNQPDHQVWSADELVFRVSPIGQSKIGRFVCFVKTF